MSFKDNFIEKSVQFFFPELYQLSNFTHLGFINTHRDINKLFFKKSNLISISLKKLGFIV